MISLVTVKKYCKDYENIENYDLAINDTTQVWECHHRKEIEDDVIRSVAELEALDLYFNRTADELIFLTKAEHNKLHNTNMKSSTKQKKAKSMTGKQHSVETKAKISKALVGNQNTLGMFVGSKNPMWKGKVECVETGEIYECGRAAEKTLGINNVNKACKNNNRTAGGFHWRYV